jgi:holo-[acyl-carrier protein] synthase
VRFAGKEAVMKALGTGAKGVSWREIEILALPTGEPVVRLHGNAEDRAKTLGLGELAISLSHSREYAVAVVVAGST